MRKTKMILSLFLVIVITILLSTVTTGAASMSADTHLSEFEKFVKLDTWIYIHPKEAIEIERASLDGDPSIIKKYFPTSEEQEYVIRMLNLPNEIGDVMKVATTTLNPQNSERGRVLSATIQNTSSKVEQKTQPDLSRLTFITTNNPRNKVRLEFFAAYTTSKGELVMLGFLENNSGNKLEIRGIQQLELKVKDQVLADGSPSAFDTPIKLAPRAQKAQGNLGVYDGLPTKCFIKITFEPGSFDDSIDISKLDYLGSAYSLDYSTLD